MIDYRLQLLLLLFFMLTSKSQSQRLGNGPRKSVAAEMKKASLVPDIIDKAPSRLIEIQFGRNAIVGLGNKLTPKDVQNPPTFIKWGGDPKKFYTLVLIDPDAPTRRLPIFRSYKHWIVGNIPGDNISEGKTLLKYERSTPAYGTGFHSYLFLLYEQPSKLEYLEEMAKQNESRMRFSINSFADKYDLGDPIAANFYMAEWDSSVPTLYERFTGQ